MTDLTQTGTGIIIALIAGVLIYGLALGTTYPLLGLFLADAVPAAWNGINAAATGLGFLLGVFVMPAFARRFGPGATVLCGLALIAASLAGLAFARDFWTIFALRLLLGCGGNMLFIVTEIALNALAPASHRGRVMGFYTAANALGFVLGPAVVALAPERPVPLLLGCAAVAALALLPFGKVRGPVDRVVSPPALARIPAAVAAFPLAFVFLFVASAIDAVVIGLLPVIALDQGFSAQAGALSVAVFHIGLLLGQPVIGWALDLFGRRPVVLGCCLASLLSALGLVAGAEIGFGATAALLFLWGAANYGLYTTGLALIGDRFAGEALAAAVAAFAAAYALAAVIAPALAGPAIDGLGAAGFYAAVAGLYLAMLLGGAAFFRPLEPTRCRP